MDRQRESLFRLSLLTCSVTFRPDFFRLGESVKLDPFTVSTNVIDSSWGLRWRHISVNTPEVVLWIGLYLC